MECGIQRLNDLQSGFTGASCGSYIAFGDEYIWLCFSNQAKNECISTDLLDLYETEASTNSDHHTSPLVKYKTQPAVIGGKDNGANILELHLSDQVGWVGAGAFPYLAE